MRTKHGKRAMLKRLKLGVAVGAGTLLWTTLFLTGPVGAQEAETTLVDVESANAMTQAIMDNLWLVIAGSMVFLMQAGFAFVEVSGALERRGVGVFAEAGRGDLERARSTMR